jgi:hypothetical protein
MKMIAARFKIGGSFFQIENENGTTASIPTRFFDFVGGPRTETPAGAAGGLPATCADARILEE